MRIGLLMLATTSVLAAPLTAQAQSQAAYNVSLPAQSLSASLYQVSKLARVQLVFTDDAALHVRAGAISGRYTLRQLLDRLVSGTGFTYRFTNANTVRVFRQDQAAAPVGAVDQAEGRVAAEPQEPDGGEIIVTGSRIRRAGYDTLEPATVVSSEYLESRGITNAADALRNVPSFGNGQSPSGNQAQLTPGANFVDRFGLGSNRTLTLVNGRRFVSTNPPSVASSTLSAVPAGLQVDLNVIPANMIERVENLAIGGAPAYGSDAIAGVVNIILKRKYEGLELSAQTGITERGDNQRLNLSALAGMDFADGRGNIMIAASYDRSDGVFGNARKRRSDSYRFDTNPLASSGTARLPGRSPATDGRVNGDVPFNTGNADGIPNSVLIRNSRIQVLTAGGLLGPIGSTVDATLLPVGFGPGGNTRLQFDDNGNLVPYRTGFPFSQVWASGGDGLSIADVSQILSDVKRTSVNLNSSYDLTDNIGFYFEGAYARVEGRELIDEPVYNAWILGGPTVATGSMMFSANDPRLTPQARTALAGLGVTEFQLSRGSVDLGSLAGASTSIVYRGVVGIKGDVDLLGRKFNFDVSANHGRTDGNFYATEVIQQNFVNALNATLNGAGQIVCDPNPVRNSAPGPIRPVADSACVPLDLFGFRRASAEALDYVTERTHARSRLEQTDFLATFGTSDLGSLWGADPIGFNIGYEHRREKGAFNPDPAQAAGRTRAAAITPVAGSFSTNEAFGELLLPIVSPRNDIPFIETLEFEGRYRYVENSVNGGFSSYTLGGRYQPISDIELRGNFTRSLRAPSIVELFMPQASSRAQFPDPCDTRNIVAGPNPAVRARNCAAFFSSYGIDGASFTSNAAGAAVPVRVGGNLDLANETANAYTFGVILRPRFLPKFQAAIDWNAIKVKGNITQLSPANLGQGCYDDPNFDTANPDAGNFYCSQFRRVRGGALNGQIVVDAVDPGVIATFVNGAYIDFRGLTADLSYRDIDLSALGLKDGSLNVGASLFYLDKLCSSNNGITITCLEGTTTNPRYTAQLNLTYVQGGFSLNLEGNYRSSTIYDPQFTVESRDILAVGDRATFNASIAYRLDDKMRFRLSATNLFDSAGPFPLTDGDLLGRRFTFMVSRTF